MTAYALRLANGQDTTARVRFGDALGLTPGATPMQARSGLRPDGGGVVTVVAGTMNVSVAPFSAWIDGTTSDAQAGYPVFSDAAVTLAIGAGHASLARVDTIVAQVRDTAFDGSGSTDTRVLVIAGTPAASPVAPTLPATCIPLRDVNVPAGLSAGNGGLASGNLGADRRQYVTGLGGVLPVANAAERDGLTVQPGAVVYRKDTDTLQVKLSSGWTTYAQPDAPWTTYTPVWTATTTNPNLVNGTLTGAYTKQIDRTVHFRIVLTFGASTTGGVGTYVFTLPVPAAAAGAGGVSFIRDSSAASTLARHVFLFNTTQVDLIDQAGTAVTNTTIPWGPGDSINITGTYEAA